MAARAAALALLVVAVAASACASNEPETVPDPIANTAAVETVVEFWYMPNGPDPASVLGREAEEFSAANPGIRIELVELPWESALTKLITAATSGKGPDVLQIGTTWVPGIAELNALAPFSDAELERLGGRDAFVEASWTSTRPLGSEDTVAVPWFLDTRAGFYRTDLFAELGLDPDEAFADWEAFEQTLATIEADGRMHAMSVSGANDWNVVHDMAPWVWAAGGDFLSADATVSAIDSADAVEGISTYQRLVAEYNHPEAFALGVDAAQELFVTGEAAITFGDPSVINDLRSTHANQEATLEGWATASFPSGPDGRQAFLGGSNLAIFASTKNPDAAFAWIEFLTSDASQRRYTHEIGMLPARQATLESDDFVDDPVFRPFVEQLPDGRQYPPLPQWLHVEVALQHHLGSLWKEVGERGSPLSANEIAARMREAAADVTAALTGEG